MAQHPKKDQRYCVYKQGDRGCAIGVSLPKKAHKEIDQLCLNASTAGALCKVQAIQFNPDEFVEISMLQRMHDNWCNESRTSGARSDATRRYRDLFLTALKA
jgi:hypothetical protein